MINHQPQLVSWAGGGGYGDTIIFEIAEVLL